MSWLEMIVTVLSELGGDAPYKDLYGKMLEFYPDKMSEVKDYKAQIRGTIEQFSSDSEVYQKNKSKNRRNLFYKKDKGHWGLRVAQQIDLTEDDDSYPEGKAKLKLHLQRERNQQLVRQAKKLYKKKHPDMKCQICGFSFKEKYGKIGEDYLEVHHIIPVSNLQDDGVTKLEDIILICANCHRMIHRKRPCLDIESLRKLLK